MTAPHHRQSLAEFRENAAETIDRLNVTGEAEILTVDGEARAVLLPPDVFAELAHEARLAHDAAIIRTAMEEVDQGKGREAGAFFDDLRGKLSALKAREPGGTK